MQTYKGVSVCQTEERYDYKLKNTQLLQFFFNTHHCWFYWTREIILKKNIFKNERFYIDYRLDLQRSFFSPLPFVRMNDVLFFWYRSDLQMLYFLPANTLVLVHHSNDDKQNGNANPSNHALDKIYKTNPEIRLLSQKKRLCTISSEAQMESIIGQEVMLHQWLLGNRRFLF